MTQRDIMVKSLKKDVVPLLIQKGFTGKFPHYKKIYNDRIELLAFMTNKWGNAFLVEISTIFPDQPTQELRNYYMYLEEIDVNDIDVFGTNKRFRLKCIFDGWFYYTDVYKSKLKISLFKNCDFYNAISEKKALSHTPTNNEVLVQKSSDELYNNIANEVKAQMVTAFEWWDKYNTPLKMKRYRE